MLLFALCSYRACYPSSRSRLSHNAAQEWMQAGGTPPALLGLGPLSEEVMGLSHVQERPVPVSGRPLMACRSCLFCHPSQVFHLKSHRYLRLARFFRHPEYRLTCPQLHFLLPYQLPQMTLQANRMVALLSSVWVNLAVNRLDQQRKRGNAQTNF